MHSDLYNTICARINEFHPLEEAALNPLLHAMEEITVKRKEVLTREGETEQYLYLVLEGVQHAVYSHQDKEATLVFSYPYSFSGIVDSLLLQRPASCRLEALTAGKLLRLSYRRLMELMTEHRSLETWLWQALALVLAGTLQRQYELLTYSAEEKFKVLLRRSPQVLNMIPHKYLASYIGVDASTFSKLLGTVRL